MSSLAEVMSVVSDQLRTALTASRVTFSHSATKGDAVEQAFRIFLRNHLPQSIGVAHGQVLDSKGTLSRQLDVILYDQKRTPILFSDEAGSNRIIPVEGVIAAIEVKTNLKLADLEVAAESARTLKTLDLSAFYMPQSPIRHVQYGYGGEWAILPPMYFVFALEGPPLGSVAGKMSKLRTGLESHQWIDMACVLDRGHIVNEIPGGDIDALPTPTSLLRCVETPHALLLFYVLMTRYVLQVERPAIALQNYLPSSFVF